MEPRPQRHRVDDHGVLALEVQDADLEERAVGGGADEHRASSSMTTRRTACSTSLSLTPCRWAGPPIRTQTGCLVHEGLSTILVSDGDRPPRRRPVRQVLPARRPPRRPRPSGRPAPGAPGRTGGCRFSKSAAAGSADLSGAAVLLRRGGGRWWSAARSIVVGSGVPGDHRCCALGAGVPPPRGGCAGRRRCCSPPRTSGAAHFENRQPTPTAARTTSPSWTRRWPSSPTRCAPGSWCAPTAAAGPGPSPTRVTSPGSRCSIRISTVIGVDQQRARSAARVRSSGASRAVPPGLDTLG